MKAVFLLGPTFFWTNISWEQFSCIDLVADLIISISLALKNTWISVWSAAQCSGCSSPGRWSPPWLGPCCPSQPSPLNIIFKILHFLDAVLRLFFFQLFPEENNKRIIEKINFGHEHRRCTQSPFRRLTGSNVSGLPFSPFFSYTSTSSSRSQYFLIKRLFGSKNSFGERGWERPKT